MCYGTFRICMSQLFKIILFFIILLSFGHSMALTTLEGTVPVAAHGNIESVANTFANFEDMLSKEHTYSGCANKDYYWIEQSGADSVTPTAIIESHAMILNADSITGQESSVHYASGNVQAYKAEDTIVADWLQYDEKYAHATGGGNVVLSRQFDVIKGQWIDYYLDLDRGVMKEAVATQYATGIYAKGDQINIINTKQFQVQNGSVTSCDPNHPAWLIRAQQVNFDYQDSQGTARNATFYAESKALFTMPLFQFPLGERRSGFLTPDVGYNSNVGVMAGVPFYWNMAPNYDMTIEPKYYIGAGFMLTDQFRYLTESGKGEIYTEQMPDSYGGEQTGYRYYWHLLDNHNVMQDVKVGYSYNRVSDNNYFTDFGNFYSSVDNINLEQTAYGNYTPSWGLLGVKVQNFQTLQPMNMPATSPIYQSLPQVNFNINPVTLGDSPFKASLISQYTNFQIANNSLQTGQRAVVYPSVTMPLQNAWGFITPKVGYNYTNYRLDPYLGTQNSSSTVNRNIPITSVDSGLVFEKPTSFNSSNYVQTLEPRLYYLYIPSVSQNNLPNFDTATASYNINQLFSENRFSGYDRINAANDLTMGLNSRLINDNTGIEFATLGVAYRQYLSSYNNLLYGSYNQFQPLYQPQPNLITELTNRWSRYLTSNANLQYDTVYNQIDNYGVQMRYNPEDFKVINARFNYQYNMPVLYYAYIPGQQFNCVVGQNCYENQYALDMSGQWPLFSNRWLLDGRANYDFTRQQWLNFLAGLEYNGGCWALRGIYGNYLANATSYTNTFFIQFELKGLSSIGSDPTQYMKLAIPGYMPISSIPGYAPITTIH